VRHGHAYLYASADPVNLPDLSGRSIVEDAGDVVEDAAGDIKDGAEEVGVGLTAKSPMEPEDAE
jgi:hypothetical protein